MYGGSGSLISLVLVIPATSIIAGGSSLPEAAVVGLVFWMTGTTASVQIPAMVLTRLGRPVARMVAAPLVTFGSAMGTGVVATFLSFLFSGANLFNAFAVLYMSVLASAVVASAGVLLQVVLEWTAIHRTPPAPES